MSNDLNSISFISSRSNCYSCYYTIAISFTAFSRAKQFVDEVVLTRGQLANFDKSLNEYRNRSVLHMFKKTFLTLILLVVITLTSKMFS